MLPVVSVLLIAIVQTTWAAIFNLDPRYGLWPKLNAADATYRIPVYIEDAKYASDPTTPKNIRTAISNTNRDLSGCVEFFEKTSPTNDGKDFVFISPSYVNGTVSATCASVPGRVTNQNGAGQKLLIVGGTAAGKCGGSIRQIMAKLANTLGERNEYQRPDRPLTVTPQNIDPSLASFTSMYSTYATSIITAYPGNPNFDYNSITMLPATTNAAPGQTMYTTPAGQSIGNQDKLSAVDCAGIKWRTGCAATTCVDPYG